MASASRLVQRFRSRELAKVIPGPEQSAQSTIQLQNPFLPFFNPITKRWAPSLYSRRRQAELIKAARTTDTLHLLPLGPKMGVYALDKYRLLADRHDLGDGQKSDESRRLNGTSRPGDDWSGNVGLGGASGSGDWDTNVEWIGDVKEKRVAGADIGARLYAGKKRMFKGHKWEREYKKRRGQISVRLRDMPKRIKRFKTLYKRRRPYALGRPRKEKKSKLPF